MLRYSRQISLAEIGEEGQQKLQKARVLLVGLGGLGTPVSLYLTAAGVGHLGIMDDDAVSLDNLHRQVLYTEADIGLPKALCAAQHLKALNGDTAITPHPFRLTAENAEEIVGQYDIVVDGTDNYATRYVIDGATYRTNRPYVYAAIGSMEGQVCIFNAGEKPCRYRDLYPTPPDTPTDKSVLGTTAAIVGSVAANEVLKLICGYGTPLAGRLWSIDLRTMGSYILDLEAFKPFYP